MANTKKKTTGKRSREGGYKYSDKMVIDAIRGTGKWAGVDGPNSSGGNVTTICDRLGCARKTFYSWLEKRAAITEAYAHEKETMLDMAEDSLMRLVLDGELGAICFFLKCQGKRRGWIEKQEIDANVNSRATVVVAPEKFASVEEWEAFVASQQK